MLRVGYPDTLPAELLQDFPKEIDLISLSEHLDHDVEIDVWIPDPFSSRASRVWPHLRGVQLVLALLAGTEWIPSLVGPHVTICNAHGAHNTSTAEWTVAAIFSLLKYHALYYDIQRDGIWKRRYEATKNYERITGDPRPLYPPVMLEELTRKTLLLVGYGSIGKDIERMLAPYDLEILRVARTPRENPVVYDVSQLDMLIPRAQVIVLIVPATQQTYRLIDWPQFELMKQGTLLVNAARGPVVNTDALVDALNTWKIRAAVDVTDPEPLPDGHPLWRCPNLLITPHVGGSSPQFAPNSLRVAAGELYRYMRGEPLHNVVQSAI
jgi:phosphoglycerate dehydrogenase-like enzyme